MEISYASENVATALQDERVLKRKIKSEWIGTLKRRIAELESAPCFGAYLRLKLGKPHPVYELGPYAHGVSITGNVRLIVQPVADSPEAVPEATSCIVKGVADYHGKSSISWYLS